MAEYAITWSPLDDLFPSQELVYRWLHAYIQHCPVHSHIPVSYRISRLSLLRSRHWRLRAITRTSRSIPHPEFLEEAAIHLAEVHDWPEACTHIEEAGNALLMAGRMADEVSLYREWIPRLEADPASCAELSRLLVPRLNYLGHRSDAYAALEAAREFDRATGEENEHTQMLAELLESARRRRETINTFFQTIGRSSENGSTAQPDLQRFLADLLRPSDAIADLPANAPGRAEMTEISSIIRAFFEGHGHDAVARLRHLSQQPDSALNPTVLQGLFLNFSPFFQEGGDPRQLLDTADSNIESFSRSGNHREVAEGLHTQGSIALHRRDAERAIHLFIESLDLFERNGDIQGAASVLMSLGDATTARASLLGMNGGADSINYYERALEIYTELGDEASIGEACGRLASTYLSLGEDERAQLYHDRMLPIAQRRNLIATIIKYDGTAGWVYAKREDWQSATERFNAMVAAAREIGVPSLEAEGIRGLATAALGRGDAGEAEALFRSAWDLAKQPMSGVFLLLAHLGRGDLEEAEAILHEVVELGAETDIPSELSQAFIYFGMATEDRDKAVEWLVRGVSIATEHEELVGVTMLGLERLAELEALPGEHPTAEALAWSALEAVTLLCQHFAAKGDYDRASKYARRAQELGGPSQATLLSQIADGAYASEPNSSSLDLRRDAPTDGGDAGPTRG
jgi:tetratricopeptide (TPR) repeat protein